MSTPTATETTSPNKSTVGNMDTKSDIEEKSIAEAAAIGLLIVDDETDFRESAARYFSRKGFNVDQAEDGEEALNV